MSLQKQRKTAKKHFAYLDLAIDPYDPIKESRISPSLNIDGVPDGFQKPGNVVDCASTECGKIPNGKCPLGLGHFFSSRTCKYCYLNNMCCLAYRAIKTRHGYIKESESSYYVRTMWYLIQYWQKQHHKNCFIPVLRQYMLYIILYRTHQSNYTKYLRSIGKVTL